MLRSNIRVAFHDGSAMVYEPGSAVRIANRGPSPVRKGYFEKVREGPPKWVGSDLRGADPAEGHRVDSHHRLLTIVAVEHAVDAPPGDPRIVES
jgi:hypothetical protein